MIFYIYKIRNKINEKIYIGQTKRLNKRWPEHKRSANRSIKIKNKYYQIIAKAIAKYGSNNFEFKIIADVETQEEADEAEEFWIALYNCRVPNGYNIKPGGNSSSHSEETKRKLSEKNKGKHISPITEFKKGLIPWNKNKKTTIEIRQKQSDAKRGKITKNIIALQSFNKGKRYSIETEFKKGQLPCNRKLNQDQADEIRIKFNNGKVISELLKEYKVSYSIIYNILKNKTYIRK
jgi:group I intron endonuclease